MFKPVATRERAVDRCASALRLAILRGELAPGERLPTERELAEQFKLNRLTVRAALGQLATAGLVSARQGSGYHVHDYLRQGGPDLLVGLAALAATDGKLVELAADLLLVRRQLARAALERLASVGVSSERRERVAAAVDRFAALAGAGGDDEELALADLEVVSALFAATGSSVLHLCLNPLAHVLVNVRELRRAIYRMPTTNVLGYRLLLAWLQAPSALQIAALVDALEAHDRASIEYLRANG